MRHTELLRLENKINTLQESTRIEAKIARNELESANAEIEAFRVRLTEHENSRDKRKARYIELKSENEALKKGNLEFISQIGNIKAEIEEYESYM